MPAATYTDPGAAASCSECGGGANGYHITPHFQFLKLNEGGLNVASVAHHKGCTRFLWF
jgi:sarcosine oxidase delta subunit